MNQKIYGDANTINEAKNAKPGDRSVYINWDAISELPAEYEVVVTQVNYDPKNLDNDFTQVGTDRNPSWYPTTQLMYKIGEACGISGGHADSAPITEEVDINPMLRKPLDAEPTYRRMTVGRSVTKQSSRLMEDGSLLYSSVCTSEYNAYERCLELWSKEEMYTDGYTKKGRYDNKYETSYQRRAHFDAEMKHAHAKAETKAHTKTIRELAGLPTGFDPKDLTSGVLIFARVRRSREVLQMETAARLSAISQGHNPGEAPARMLFGPTVEDTPPSSEPSHAEPSHVEPEPTFTPPPPEPEPVKKTKREELISVLKYYQTEKLITPDLDDTVFNVIAWLNNTPDAEKQDEWWAKAMSILKMVEDKVPAEGRITHNL